MRSDEEAMARSSFGYGRWEAPYWFLGPEQGKGPTEVEKNELRIKAWQGLGRSELSCCRAFHDAIGEERWHQKARLQPTWRQLITLLLAFERKATDKESVREYQRDHWGRSDGNECVIELSGVAARSLSTPGDRELFLQERIALIRRRFTQFQPRFLVMYGADQHKSWEKIAGCALETGVPVLAGTTTVVWTKHPVAHGLGNDHWIELGRRLREHVEERERIG